MGVFHPLLPMKSHKKEEISALNTSDAKQLLKIVSQDVFVRDLSESQPPKSIEGIRCLVEYHSELQEDLVDFLLTLPFDKLGIWAVGGWDSCIPKTSNVRDKLRLNKIAARWPAKAVAQFFLTFIKKQ